MMRKLIYFKPSVRVNKISIEAVICASDPDKLTGEVKPGTISSGSVGAKGFSIWDEEN